LIALRDGGVAAVKAALPGPADAENAGRKENALIALWGAACATYASVGAPLSAEPPVASETPPWKEIFTNAVAKNVTAGLGTGKRA
jgi:hypothetical protein